MEIFSVLLSKVFVLYLVIVLGYGAGRWLGTRKESVASLLIYILVPVVYMEGALKARLEMQFLVLPLLFFGLCCLASFLIFISSKPVFGSPQCNLLAYAGAICNNGYLGIPLGLALFGDGALPMLVLCGFGITIFEATFGIYVLARGRYSVRDSIIKLLRLPVCYALVLGILLNYLGVELNAPLADLALKFRGAYTVLGMMLIGLAVADMGRTKFDWAFNIFLLGWKFICWPLGVLILLYLDGHFVGLFQGDTRRIIFFISTLPLAASTVVFATLFDIEPEKTSLAVLLSTLLALLAVPLFNALIVL